MDKVISVKAWKRPDYFKEMLGRLEKADRIDTYKRIIISIDYSEKAWEIQDIINESKLKNKIEIYIQGQQLGCAGNMRFCLDMSFNDTKVGYMVHLEDDIIVSKDFLTFMDWAFAQMDKDPTIFATCPFNRKSTHQEWVTNPSPDSYYIRSYQIQNDPSHKIFNRHDNHIFDGGGGYGITKHQWNHIQSKGGLFGVIGDIHNNLFGDAWKKKAFITDLGSWVWTFNKYMIGDKKVLFPTISRTNNIGSKGGTWDNTDQFHKEHIWDDQWIESKEHQTSTEFRLQ